MAARVLPLLLSALLLCAAPGVQARGHHHHHGHAAPGEVSVVSLPPEAQKALSLIRSGGPFPYARDGVVFGNHEHRLPARARGYYHEYTVPTPGLHNRGPRRIVCGPLPECYYSADHYRSFRRIREDR
jgi:ribonuclease T1